ncbi:DNA helicase [Tanacetum coccineum]
MKRKKIIEADDKIISQAADVEYTYGSQSTSVDSGRQQTSTTSLPNVDDCASYSRMNQPRLSAREVHSDGHTTDVFVRQMVKLPFFMQTTSFVCKRSRSTKSVPNASAESHQLRATIVENICPNRSFRRCFATNQSNLPVQVSRLPITGEQQLDISDTIRNQSTTNEISIFDRDVLQHRVGQPLLTPPERQQLSTQLSRGDQWQGVKNCVIIPEIVVNFQDNNAQKHSSSDITDRKNKNCPVFVADSHQSSSVHNQATGQQVPPSRNIKRRLVPHSSDIPNAYVSKHYENIDRQNTESSHARVQAQIDEYISAELPDPVENPRGYKVVSQMMMHGPCGAANLGALCMQSGPCNKHFTNIVNNETFFDSIGHVQCRKRDTKVHVIKHESKLENCNVVPYNRALCLAFEAHINVEYCGWSMLIKYLFKYISKGPDRILTKISKPIGEASNSTGGNEIQIDEIQNYIMNVHLENKQRINFRERDRLEVIVNLPDRKKTTLTEWYVYNNENTDGQELTYLNFLSEFVWYPDSKTWRRRQIKAKKSIGRLTYVHPNSGELFYFRMLLCHQKGCLLGDDKQWDIAFEESTASATSSEIRTLFAQILIYCEIEAILNGFGKSIRDFGLQTPPRHLLKDLKNKLLMEEKNYKRELLMQDAAESVPKLNLASSGITSLLLPAGRTAHSRFKLPLDLTDESLQVTERPDERTIDFIRRENSHAGR